MSLRLLLTWVLLLSACIAPTGCSSFRPDSRAAKRQTTPPRGPEGLWTGTWHDEKRPGHGGRLDVVLTRTGDQLYRLTSRSRWWKLFRSSLDSTVVITPVAPGEYSVSGGTSIWGFGDYDLAGRIGPETFTATYAAAGHRGVIELRRPAR